MESKLERTPPIGAVADGRLLEAGDAELPAAVGRPEPLPRSRARAPIVAAGATLTGLALVGGVALVVLAVVRAFVSGADLLDGALLVIGVALLATHWGWVHVAEGAANALETRGARHVTARRAQWLRAIAPYTRHEVITDVEDDGSISIVSVSYRPVTTSEGRFAFEREIESRELHSADEPAAEVAARSEHLRRDAAAATERQRRGFLAAADRLETERLRELDERELRDARRSASRALSEQINANLRSPPLDE